MECLINPAVDYHKIYDQIKSQKDNLLEIILQDHRKQNDTIYTLGDQNEHRQYVNSDSEILSRIRGLKGISESTWSEEEYKQLKDKPRGTSLKASCLKIIDQLTKHKSVILKTPVLFLILRPGRSSIQLKKKKFQTTMRSSKNPWIWKHFRTT